MVEFVGTDLQRAGVSAFVPGGVASWSPVVVDDVITLSAAQFQTVLATPSNVDYVITLPNPSGVTGQVAFFKRLASANTGKVILSGPIDDLNEYVLEYDGEFVTLFSDGSAFYVVGE